MRTALRAAILCAAALASCSGGEDGAPRWIRLAASRASTLVPARERIVDPGGRVVAIETDEHEARLALRFRPGDWKRGHDGSFSDGSFSTELPFRALALRHRSSRAVLAELDDRPQVALAGEAPYRLRDERGEYQPLLAGALKEATELPARGFLVLGSQLVVNPGDATPPAGLVLEVREERGTVEEEHRRFRGSRLAGEGLVVWPGEELELRVETSPRSALFFGLLCESRLQDEFERGRELSFSIELDGQPLFEERIACGDPEPRWRSVPLPAAGGPARLSFSVQGAFAHTVFVAPTIGPLEKGAPGARPWAGARPDVVVFLADTFRADNLAAYGGRAELTPFLNELAARSLLFTRAWSTATYTLAAHASLFTGRFPQQAGIVDNRSALSRDLHTLAEFFAALGYRTGAVTDQGYVTQTFGMDQGFQAFDEHRGTFPETAARARAFLDADDGRPLFLFVQTYRTHKVYDVSAEARAALGIEARSTRELRALESEYDGLSARAERTPGERERMAEIARELELRYRGTAWDLDRGFARFFGELETRGFFRNGYLVFTSDHGEAFDEHGQIFHLGEVHEEQVRVPLFLYGSGMHGPELRAERVDWPASLVDLAPTLADLAGAQPDPAWLGTSLLELDAARPIYAFQSNRESKTGSTLCVIEGGRKVIGLEDAAGARVGGLRYAYALEADPLERSNLSGEAWPRELLERHRAALDAALRPLGALTSAATTSEELRELEAMGYAGGDE